MLNFILFLLGIILSIAILGGLFELIGKSIEGLISFYKYIKNKKIF